MAQQLVTMVQVSMDYNIPAPRTVWATDDSNDDEKYITQYDPPVDLMEEIFAKLIAFQANKKPVQLMIDSGRYIVRDPSFPVP
jgi:hypothetical protein